MMRLKKWDFGLSHLYSRDYLVNWLKLRGSKNTSSILPFIDRKSLWDWKHIWKSECIFMFLTDLEGKGSSKTWVETVVWFETFWFETNKDVGLLDLILMLLPELMVLLRETWLEKRIKGLELSFKNDWNASKSDQSGVFESGLALGEFSGDSLISSAVLKFLKLLLSL